MILSWASSAQALDVTTLYLGACNRVTGILLQVNSSHLKILSLDGKIEELPRYEVTYLATYPADYLPISGVANADLAPPIRVFTRVRRQVVELLEGWPVEFSEDKMAFLTTAGEGAVVDKGQIWKLEVADVSKRLNFKNRFAHRPLEFAHPQVFSKCKLTARTSVRTLVAQQLLSEPITIKREFDRLQKGHELVETYMRRQKFYPVPNIYGKGTALSLWTSVGSRYGASESRSNNFTPHVRHEYNSGPFSYQHEMVTGSGPNPNSNHEEPQTQIYYRFKADYFQFFGMTDPSFLLIGANNYRWSARDLKSTDFRISDVARMGFAFDYGAFSFGAIPLNQINTGARSGAVFEKDSVSLPRLYFSYRAPDFLFEIDGGAGDGDHVEMTFLRINTRYQYNEKTSFSASLIQRSVTAAENENSRLDTESDSSTVSVIGEHLYRGRFLLGAFASVEKFSADIGPVAGAKTSTDESYFKAGAMIGLTF